ncbi:MAG: selenocysteine-specific translation elongation factor [Acidobacteriota bacterium]
MRAVVFGTAGHIDHGKTSLVKALTGVDCDRLGEEKRRGITLVLGFAPLADPDGELEISFIDVPGHERLVHTMIAGAGGIDRALLVIAADEGVMPQTREHLDILALLGVHGGVVALNKADLLDDELLAVRRGEVSAALAGGPLDDAPIVPCSAVSGLGIEHLREEVLACARHVMRERDAGRPFRLSADRVFTLPGAGTVVTGTAHWGTVKAADELTALPSGRRVRVRGLQVHGHNRDEAVTGERVAMRLAGASVEEIPRGEQLLGKGPWRASDRLAVHVRLLGGAEPLAEGQEVWLHILAARVLARVVRIEPDGVGPGGQGVVIVRLAHGVFAAPGDRVILRRVSPARTLGGGTVRDTHPPRLRRSEAAQLPSLPDPVADRLAALARWIREAGPNGVTVDEVAARLGFSSTVLEADLGRLVAGGAVTAVRGRPAVLIDSGEVAAVEKAARALLEAAGATGVPLAELTSRVLPDGAAPLRDFYLEVFRRSGVLRESAGRAVAGGVGPIEDELTARVEALYREAGLDAPSPEEAAARLGARPKVVEGLVRALIDHRRLARVGGKWVLHRELLDEIARSVRDWGVEAFDVGQFKARFALTRKLAIPILEWLDGERVTRREGERRRVLRNRGGTNSAG